MKDEEADSLVDQTEESEEQVISEEKEEVKQEVKKRGRKKQEEVKEVDNKDITRELYNEFSSFLEQKNDIVNTPEPNIFIPTGIQLLDSVLGGGFALGTFGVVAGYPGSGKSMICCQAIANAQKVFGNDLICVYLDSEESTTGQRLASLGVLNPQIKPYKDVTVEKVFRVVESLCLFKEEKEMIDKPSIIVWDSLANSLTEKEREVEDINQVIGYKAKVLSFLLPKYLPKLAKYNISLITVNQLRDSLQMGQFAPPKELKFMTMGKDIPGGTAMKFNAFQLLEMKVKTVTHAEKNGFDGFIAGIKCVKNKAFSPNIEVEIVGDFVKGFNNFWTNYNFLVSKKRIVAAAWNYLVDFPSKKFRTKDAETLYNTDPEFKKMYDEKVKETIKTEILDRYNPEALLNDPVPEEN